MGLICDLNLCVTGCLRSVTELSTLEGESIMIGIAPLIPEFSVLVVVPTSFLFLDDLFYLPHAFNGSDIAADRLRAVGTTSYLCVTLGLA